MEKKMKLNKGVSILIKKMGGQKALADALNVDLSLIYRWLHSKLPPHRAPDILSLMKKEGFKISLNKFNSTYFDKNNAIKFK